MAIRYKLSNFRFIAQNVSWQEVSSQSYAAPLPVGTIKAPEVLDALAVISARPNYCKNTRLICLMVSAIHKSDLIADKTACLWRHNASIPNGAACVFKLVLQPVTKLLI